MNGDEESPKSSADWENIARDLYIGNRNADAMLAITRALSVDPENYDALILAATILGELDAPVEEIASLYDRAISKKPSDPEAYSHKAMLYGDKGRTAEALELAKRAVDLVEQQPATSRDEALEVYDTYMGSLHYAGLLEEAREIAKRIRERYASPAFAEFLWRDESPS